MTRNPLRGMLLSDGGGVRPDPGEGPDDGDARAASNSSAASTDDHGSPSGPLQLAYSPALDGIRALAVLAVTAYHYNYSWARGGFLGVDTFFVLSGFLITTLLVLEFRRTSSIRLTAFWARRARRLLPALLVVLCFVAAYVHFVVVPWDRIRIRNDMLATLFYVANWRFLFDKQSYFEIFSAASPVRHMWSLAIEEQYYLVWPLVVLACLRLGRGSVRVLGIVCVVGGAASIVAMQLRFAPGDPTKAYYATDARAHTILIGALLAVVADTWHPGERARGAIALAGVVAGIAVVGAWYAASGTAAWYYHGGSAVFAVVAAALIAGALQRSPVSAVLSFGPLPWIGRISYGLYLWHWPIDVWLVPSRVHLGSASLNLVRLALTFAAATASYEAIERPIRERVRRPRATAAAFGPAVVALTGVIALSTTGTAARPGFTWEIGDPLICGPRPSEVQEAIDADERSGPLPLPAAARQERILLVGDSTACSLWPGLDAVGRVEGIATDQGSIFGCGIASDEITTTRNEAITPHSSRCHDLVDSMQRQALARARPTLVIWMSVWEKSDLVVDGRTVVAGTPEGEAEIMARMDAALARLTAGGARVVVVTEPAPAPNPWQPLLTTDPLADDAGYVRLAALLRRFQARHADTVTLVDLAAKVCPSGPPCPERVEGLDARPDGHHFTPASAVWAARWLLSQVFADAQ